MARRLLTTGGLGAHRPRRYTRPSAPEAPVGGPEEVKGDGSNPEEPPAPENPDESASQEPPAEDPPAPPEVAEPMPGSDSSISVIMEWVEAGSVPADRAQAALDQENQRPKKDRRSTLVKRLEGIIAEREASDLI